MKMKCLLGAVALAGGLVAAGAAPALASTSSYTVSTNFNNAFIAGATDTGNHCDDCTTAIGLPFSVPFYGGVYATAVVSSNGNLQFAGNSSSLSGGCAPIPGLGASILAYQGDLRTDVGGGIYTNTFGSAPNRVFVVEWRSVLYADNSQNQNFEIRFTESSGTITTVYGANNTFSGAGTIGVQDGSVGSTYQCGGTPPQNGLNINFVPSGATVTTYQENAATYKGTWSTSHCVCFSGGYTRYATLAGSSASFIFTGTKVGFVSERAPDRGSFKVYVDGVYKTTVSNYSSPYKQNNVVVWSKGFTSSGTHTLRIVVVGTAGHPRVDVDAFNVTS